ncbi:MAG: hypothetical protein JWL81_3178 [Verrucomicrobiales bacterium]|nr:hypothetical protein [Verrucomicrobiales bacterium]
MNSTTAFRAVLTTSALLTATALGQVVINEIHAAPNERILRYDEQGQAHLGSGPSWWEPGFQDTAWDTLTTPAGFGFPDLATNLGPLLEGNTPSLYLRKTFNVSAEDAASGRPLGLLVDFNDGFIAFLNGREIARSNTGPRGLFFYADQTALVPRADSEAPAVFQTGAASGLLIPGENILAFHVVNFSEDAKGNLRFAASLGIDEGKLIGTMFEDDFNYANGSSLTHRNMSGNFTAIPNGTPPPGSWLELAPVAESSAGWADLTIATRLAAASGVSGGGALEYTFTANGASGTAVVRGPAIDLSSARSGVMLTEADLASLELSLKYKALDGFAADFGLEPVAQPAAFLNLPALPPVTGNPAPDTVGFWRFDDSTAANAGTIGRTASLTNASVLSATGQNSARYSTDVPGALTYDPLTGSAWPNKFSLNAAAANARVIVPDSQLLNTPDFTLEFFIKLTGEPLGFDAFARRGIGVGTDSATASTRRSWQVEFDSSAAASAYGRLRARWDTPGSPPLDWNRGAAGGLVFADTPVADGNPFSYGAGDPQAAGDGVNDSASRKWRHVALTWNGATKKFNVISDYQTVGSQTLAAPFVHPVAALELGKTVATAYGLNLDEIRYTSRVLSPAELLRALTPDASGFTPISYSLQSASADRRAAFVSALNSSGDFRVRPALRLRPESLSPSGKTLLLDDFKITRTTSVAGLEFVSADDSWKFVPGLGEPSGGVWDPLLPRELNTQDQQFSVAAFPDLPEFSDWIELHNTSGTPQSLDGFALTDDPTQSAKWSLPAGLVIPANGYLLVLADEKSEVPGLHYPHANFSLNADGEALRLFKNGVLQDAVDFPRQDTFHSYGRSNAGGFSYLEAATPGAANSEAAAQVRAKTPDFQPEGGFYADTVNLTISSASAGAHIRYTTDGSEPTAANGTDYTGPIPLTRVNEKTGRVIRARSFLPTGIPSGVRTATYLIGQHPQLRTIPALVVTGDPRRDLYKPYGIMSIEGGAIDANNIWSAVDADDYNLALFHGRAYERSVFAEWFPIDGSPGFAESAGLRLASSPHARPRLKLQQTDQSPFVSTSFEKPSFNLFFRGDYGKTELDYPVLGRDYPVKSFDQIRARAGKNDIVNPFIKDELIRRTFIDMGHPVVRGTFNTLYLNGVYKGFYNTVERYRAPFFQAHYGTGADWDIRINDNVEDGDTAGWTALLTALGKDLATQANFDAALEKLDLDEVIDYYLINIYTAQSDWPNNNWVAARERNPHGKYRLYLWDSEISFAQNPNKPVSFDTIQVDLKNLSGSLPGLFRLLVASSEIRLRFADRIQHHFFNNGALDDRAGSASRVVKRRNALAAEINPVMQFTVGQTVNPSFLDTWVQPANGRRYWLFDSAGKSGDASFRKHGLWPATPAPVFSQQGGAIPAGQFLTLSAPSQAPVGSSVFYTVDGTDPRLFGGAVSPSALTAAGPIILPEAPQIVLTARVRNAVTGEWSPANRAVFVQSSTPASAANLVISQIQYHPPNPTAREAAAGFTDGDDFEYLELLAIGTDNVDLSQAAFTAGISFQFSSGSILALAPGGRVVIVRNPAAFALRYGAGAATTVAGQYIGKLDNSGETLRLAGADGSDADTLPDTILDFSYDDELPWPTAADGFGPSLNLTTPQTLPDHALATNWNASGPWAGAPGGTVATPGWAQWVAWQFPYAATEPGTTGPNDDPDHDGVVNLLEFAHGLNPTQANAAAGFQLRVVQNGDGDRLVLSGVFPANLEGVRMTAEAGSNLSDWVEAVEIPTVPPPVSSPTPAPGFTTRQWRDPAPLATGTPRFMRLRARLDSAP